VGFILVDGINVLYTRGRNGDSIRGALRSLGEDILSSSNFLGCGVKIFCDCPDKNASQKIFGNGKGTFTIVFCPKHKGGADKFILDEAIKIYNNGDTKDIVVVTSDKELRIRILFALPPIGDLSFLQFFTAEELMEKLKER